MSFFAGLWPIFWHYSLGVTFIGICIAVAVFSVALQIELAKVPFIGGWLAGNIRNIREWAIVAAVVAVAFITVYSIGVKNGESRKQAQWDAAEIAAANVGSEAHASAVRSVERSTPDGVRLDPYNRDHH